MAVNKKTPASLFDAVADVEDASPSTSSSSAEVGGITSTAFAKILKVSPATIWRAIQDGRISRGVVRVDKGWRILDVDAARRDYLEHTSRMAARGLEAGEGDGDEEDEDELEDDDKVPNYTRERSLKVRVERLKKELELSELRGDLVRLSSVSGVIYAALSSIRTSALSLADRLAPELADIADAHEIRTLLRRDLVEMLTAAADELERRAILQVETAEAGA